MILGSIFNGIMARVANKRAEDYQGKALQSLDKEEAELDNLFKSSYYSDYMRRADVQNLISSAKDTLQANTNNMRGRATVMGATDEWIGANQKNYNSALSSLYSNIVSQGANWKDSVLNNYMDRKSNINSRRANSFFNNANTYQNTNLNYLSNIGDDIRGMDNAFSNVVMGGIKKLGF
ncbi:MAG: hypothetical protein IKV14_06450 [Muribaculaceae bacterium]|nr:hypothetical protein [Muribaculaceae bacterium]